VFVLLGLASTALTRSVEMAQLTTTPVLVAPLALSGLLFPVDRLPDPLQRVGEVLPLTRWSTCCGWA
jgi:ABC-2 type transport system permease protein